MMRDQGTLGPRDVASPCQDCARVTRFTSPTLTSPNEIPKLPRFVETHVSRISMDVIGCCNRVPSLVHPMHRSIKDLSGTEACSARRILLERADISQALRQICSGQTHAIESWWLARFHRRSRLFLCSAGLVRLLDACIYCLTAAALYGQRGDCNDNMARSCKRIIAARYCSKHRGGGNSKSFMTLYRCNPHLVTHTAKR